MALVLAGGTGSRMGRPKQFIDLLGAPALLYTLRAFQEAPEISRIYTVGGRARIGTLIEEAGISKYAGCASPGESRSLSTRNGLSLLEEGSRTIVLVHDGSRCLVTPDLIRRVVAAAAGDTDADGVVPALPVSDTVKVAENGAVLKTLDRAKLHTTQTPQAFRLGLLREVYMGSEERLHVATDDASLVEEAGGRILIVAGEKTNIKLTSPEDLILAEAILSARASESASYVVRNCAGRWPRRVRKEPEISRAETIFRVGLGVDVHAFAREAGGGAYGLVLGGVEIPFERVLLGHSDADVLAHAVTDALLGAAGLEDIGYYFPDTDERYKNANSMELLREVRATIVGDSWEVANVDAVVICERPKIRDHREAMRENLAKTLSVDPTRVSVRGTTTERLGFPGRGEGIAAQAVCLLEGRR